VEATERKVQLPETRLDRVRFMDIGITDTLREGLQERGFEEGGRNSPTVVTASPAPLFVEELAKRYETVVVIGPPGPWFKNKSITDDLRVAGAAGIHEWPLLEEEECAEALAEMLNEALG